MNSINIEYISDWEEYELIDSGEGEKLERFGPIKSSYTVIRPDPRIIWSKSNPSLWTNVDAQFVRTGSDAGKWIVHKQPPIPWKIHYHNFTFILKPTNFKHTGIFPEQAVNWNWIKKTLSLNKNSTYLNLFAYTGGATMALASTGANVTHVDSSGSAISWTKENLFSSGFDDKPVRFIHEDVLTFVDRELRRGNLYDGVILDPPRFGHGTKGEIWKLASDLPVLLSKLEKLLSPNAKFLLLNAYTADLSPIALHNLVQDICKNRSGNITSAELCIRETQSSRLVPHGVCVRWLNDKLQI